MAKYITYNLKSKRNIGTEDAPKWEEYEGARCSMPYSERAEEIAKAECWNGEYTIEDDGEPEPEATPTQLDRVEAQAMYTALMTDTLLEEDE